MLFRLVTVFPMYFLRVICKVPSGYVPSTTRGNGFVRLIKVFTAFMVLREMSNAKKGPLVVLGSFLGMKY